MNCVASDKAEGGVEVSSVHLCTCSLAYLLPHSVERACLLLTSYLPAYSLTVRPEAPLQEFKAVRRRRYTQTDEEHNTATCACTTTRACACTCTTHKCEHRHSVHVHGMLDAYLGIVCASGRLLIVGSANRSSSGFVRVVLRSGKYWYGVIRPIGCSKLCRRAPVHVHMYIMHMCTCTSCTCSEWGAPEEAWALSCLG